MATRAKPNDRKKGSKKKATRKRKGANDLSAADVRGYFERIHNITNAMEEQNATARGDIKAVYEEAADKLDAPKSVLKFLFAKDRREVKDNAKARKMDSRERESMERLAADLGGELGQWARDKAALGGTGEGLGDGEGAGGE